MVQSIEPKEAYGQALNHFAVIIDVREKDELMESGTAEPAQWMPLSEVEANSPRWQEFVKALPKDKKIITYCAAGRRSGRVGEKLAALGFEVANMGGFKDWKAAGLPVKTVK